MTKLIYRLTYIVILICATFQVNAQISITNIDPSGGYINSEVVITGNGFGTNAANIEVWFGAVKGTTVSVDDKLITALVPAGARADNIAVINKSTGRLAHSGEKFYPVFSGGTFDGTQVATPVVYTDPSGKQPFEACTCDLNGDGLAEIISTKASSANDITTITILENTSTFENISYTPIQIAVGFPTLNIGCGDLNGDGRADLYMSQNGVTRFHVLVLPNTSAGAISFGPVQSLNLATDVATRRVAHRDLNGDNKPEIIVSNSGAGMVHVFQNTSSVSAVSFAATPVNIAVTGASSTSGLEVQDVDGDGRADIITTPFVGNDIFILRNSGLSTISFEAPVVLQLDNNSLTNITTGDFNGDARLDIAAVGNLSGKVVVFPNTSSAGSVSFGSTVEFDVNPNPWGIYPGDVDGDGLLDLAVTSLSNNSLAILNNQSSGGNISFVKKNVDAGSRGRNVVIQDIDGDAKPDFVVAAQNGSVYDVRVVRNTNCFVPTILNDQPLGICTGQTLTLEAPYSPNATLSWTRDGGAIAGTANTLDITTSGNYQIQAVTESGGCTTTSNINVASGTGSVPGNPVATQPLPACIGGEVTLNVATVAGATYRWTGPAGFTATTQNPVISNLSLDNAGIYTVVVKDGDCRSSESSVTLELIDIPSFSVTATGATSVCAGSAVSLSTQSRSGYTYQWQKDGTNIGGATGNTYSATTSGVYRVVIDDTGSSCQAITNAVEVRVYSQPTAAFTVDNAVCTGEELTFVNSSTVDPTATVTYSWNFGDGGTSSAVSPLHTYTTAQVASAVLNVSYAEVASGCTSSANNSITITEATVPVIQSSLAAICPGEATVLSLTETFSSYEWSTTQTSASITVDQPGVYNVTTIDTNGCTGSDAITIASRSVPDLQVVADNNVVAVGDAVQLQASGAQTYSWSPSTYLSDSTVANPISTPEQTITYTVTGTSADGCTATASIVITVVESDEIDITPLKAFSPNSIMNPTWEIQNIEAYPDCTMSIFDERGSLVYRKQGYSNDWDATYAGNPLPEGVYYFVFSCESLKPKTGSVLVVR